MKKKDWFQEKVHNGKLEEVSDNTLASSAVVTEKKDRMTRKVLDSRELNDSCRKKSKNAEDEISD